MLFYQNLPQETMLYFKLYRNKNMHGRFVETLAVLVRCSFVRVEMLVYSRGLQVAIERDFPSKHCFEGFGRCGLQNERRQAALPCLP